MKNNNWKYWIFVFMLMTSLYCLGQRQYRPSQLTVYWELVKNGVRHPDIVLGQSLLETGYYKCKGCSMDYNNLFGYGWDGNSYYSYDNWKESVANYARWQKKHYHGGDYYEFLDRAGYATSTRYIKDLRWIVKHKLDI